MLYVVILTYIRPTEEVHAHLDTHRAWLAEHGKSGSIIVAGPLDDGSGGALIVSCENRAALDGILESDSFHVHKLVEYQIRAFTGALRAAAFPAQWAPQAKPV